MLLGLRRDEVGRLETTRWLTLFYIPVLPLGRWRVEYLGTTGGEQQDDETLLFARVERLPLDLEGMSRTVLAGWALGVIAIGPAIAGVLLIQGAANNWQMAGVFASCIWPLVVLLWVQRRQRRFVRRRSDEVGV
jgi:hypothetical protein